MRKAIADQRRIFNLPDEMFTYQFRPWEIRSKWDRNPDIYKEYRPILNLPSQPEIRRRPRERNAPVEDDEDDEWQESQEGDSYYFKIVPCRMHFESLCFKARSTIDGAGNGLFLKPHPSIPKGVHLCLYAEKFTSEAEINDIVSSRFYAMYVPRLNAWYDVELETGNNFARFANQLHVQETLESMKRMSASDMPEVTESDWK